MEQLGNVLEDGKEYFWDLREECPTELNEILTSCSHYLINTCIEHFRKFSFDHV